MILFNIPTVIGNEMKYIKEALLNHTICGDGLFTNKCNVLLQEQTKTSKCLLTTSCTLT